MGNRTYTSWIFLRLFGIIYCFAFISILGQILPLSGSNGLYPIATSVSAISNNLGAAAYGRYPTLSLLNASDIFLIIQCWLGIAAALLLATGVLAWLGAILSVVLYLSLSVAGGLFFSFQWDVLLLEIGFLICFLTPYTFIDKAHKRKAPSGIILGLLLWLLFRLIFASGAVKLLSGDEVWRNFTALTVHYQTQPLPTPLAWYFHHLPLWFHQFAQGIMFAIELILPVFIFGPRICRLIAFWGFALLMVMISLTGNYCFFNLMTVLLALILLDDRYLGKIAKNTLTLKDTSQHLNHVKKFSAIVFMCFVMIFTTMNFTMQMRLKVPWPGFIHKMKNMVAPFRLFNHYGLFANMTETRPEIIIEGSLDGIQWKAYAFKYKPPNPDNMQKAPVFNMPHQPRLDWQMWFAALGGYRQNQWLIRFGDRLLRGDAGILRLMATNPFPDKPPKYIRATLYEYRFSTPEERAESGDWWVARNLGPYWPSPLALNTKI